MEKYRPCYTCKGTGFRNRNKSIICGDCHGSGNSSRKLRGFNTGQDSRSKLRGADGFCWKGHPKEGTMVDLRGNIVEYCLICHREMALKNYYKRKAGATNK
jgi:hypothetical protein